jgi:hypothetical protein
MGQFSFRRCQLAPSSVEDCYFKSILGALRLGILEHNCDVMLHDVRDAR